MKRIFLASLLAGIAMYVWSSVAHVLLPLGQAGIKVIPNEQPVLDAASSSIKDDGFYFFPGMGSNTDPKAMAEKLKTSPSGILIYHPAGHNSGMTPAKLGGELLVEVLASMLAVWLLSKARITSYGSRVGFVAVVGLTAAVMTNLQYWIWYGFPAAYTAVYMLIEILGFIVAGLVAAKVLKSGTAIAAAA